MRLFSVLTLLPAALAAQAPAAAPAQTAPAAPVAPVAPSLADQYKAQEPAITALIKTDPAAALTKAEALIPASVPAFDKKDIGTAQKSMGEYDALSKIYALAANAANSSGQWEKAKDYAGLAKSTAQSNYDDALAPMTAFQDTWKKAQADSQTKLDEMASLAKVEKPTPEQTGRLAFLQKNQQVFTGNVAHGKQMVDAVDANLNGLKSAPSDYDPFINNVALRLKDEAGNIEKFKGDKKAFAAAALKGADAYKDKDSEVTYLRRLQVLDPSSKAIPHKIDVLLGKAKDEPVKSGKRRTHKKGH